VSKPNESVAVVLNIYKRGDAFERQLQAVRDQTVTSSEILVWQNESHYRVPREKMEQIKLSLSNVNFGVWSRFAYALNTSAEYICVLDDDTIPGSRWFENCLETMKASPGLLGTRGIRFHSKKSYLLADEVGWRNPNYETQQVDIVGHSWFFKREWLLDFWAQPRLFPSDNLVGEDIHFSFALQKRLGLNTYVPPHPENAEEFWGSRPESGRALGSSDSGISMRKDASAKFQAAFEAYIYGGFELCAEKSIVRNSVSLSIARLNQPRLQKLIDKSSNAQKIRAKIRNMILDAN